MIMRYGKIYFAEFVGLKTSGRTEGDGDQVDTITEIPNEGGVLVGIE